MCQFIETICYDRGQFWNIGLNQDRFDRTRQHFFGTVPELRLELLLEIPTFLAEKTVKCRVIYRKEIVGIEYGQYKIRPVRSLQLVHDDSIDYRFKFADRSKIGVLYQMRGEADDILIVKKGHITDTSYANVVFKKDSKWYSPQNPLLKGVRLESYHRNGRIIPALISPEELIYFSEARIINSMIAIEDSPVIPIENILSSIV